MLMSKTIMKKEKQESFEQNISQWTMYKIKTNPKMNY